MVRLNVQLLSMLIACNMINISNEKILNLLILEQIYSYNPLISDISPLVLNQSIDFNRETININLMS